MKPTKKQKDDDASNEEEEGEDSDVESLEPAEKPKGSLINFS